MNIKQLEAHIKALAPVVKQYVKEAADALKTELQGWVKSGLEALETRLNDKIEAVKSEIPAPDTREHLDSEAVKALIAEEFEPVLEAIGQREDAARKAQADAQQQKMDELFDQFNDRFAKAWVKYVEEMEKPLEWPKLIDPEALKNAVSGFVKAEMAGIPAPEPAKHGKDGENGKDGKDALQLEILPAIDFEKSYPRNTYAQHNGGLLRAWQQTDGEKGWETVINGVADVQIEQKSAREFEVHTVQTNGKAQKSVFTVPVMIHRGVYRENDDYLQGDTVTFGGSLWHAEKDHPSGKPGAGEPEKTGWRLAAKKGRDGKNGGAN